MGKSIDAYWTWLLLMIISWALALFHVYSSTPNIAGHLIGCACFFSCFFICPLLRERPRLLFVVLGIAVVLATIALWPLEDGEANPYALLVFFILEGKAFYRLPLLHAWGICLFLLVGMTFPALMGYVTFSPVFLICSLVMLGFAGTAFSIMNKHGKETSQRSEALLSEYRQLKRRLAASEALARHEERTQIARDIHDSVGHKLTALLMQLEVFRMKAGNEVAGQVQDLKVLARDSLEETRQAVKTLREQDVGGLSAILSLIRQLEVESFVRIQFSVKPGALSAPLSNQQAIAIYRAVQEALTNSMRHSGTREAEVFFEAPGGSVFRFEIANPIKKQVPLREGFGLTAMRERIEQAGGQLEVVQYHERFVVRGTLPLLKKENEGT